MKVESGGIKTYYPPVSGFARDMRWSQPPPPPPRDLSANAALYGRDPLYDLPPAHSERFHMQEVHP